MNEINKSFLNPVKSRFLPLPRSATEGLEHEANIKDFTIIKQLGFGSFGTVHLARHNKTKAQYAIKIIDKTLPENLEEKANFNREVEIMYKLDHPNIVKLYGHFEDNKFCYFIMQFIPKKSLYDIITKPKEKPNLKLIASVMKDLISAVYYLHNMKPNIIHRDIKPENILLDEDNNAYLTDFGWSNYIRGDRKRTTICGSPLYLPPEMFEEAGHDKTADIWCIGVLLFELIAGYPPFAGNDIITVKNNISRLKISWPSSIDPDAKDLISKILKLNGKDRLPIEEILKHKFFTRFFPDAINQLIKPENQKSRIFVVSTDTPETWGNLSSLKSKNSTDNKFKKVNIGKSRETDSEKEKNPFIPRANIDLSQSSTNERDTKNKKIIGNNQSNKSSLNSTYTKTTTSYKTNSNISFNSGSDKIRGSYKDSSYNNNPLNKYRNSYKTNISNNNISSSDKYRKSFKPSNITKDNNKTNSTINNTTYNYTKVNSGNINSSHKAININSSTTNNYRRSYRPEIMKNYYSNK